MCLPVDYQPNSSPSESYQSKDSISRQSGFGQVKQSRFSDRPPAQGVVPGQLTSNRSSQSSLPPQRRSNSRGLLISVCIHLNLCCYDVESHHSSNYDSYPSNKEYYDNRGSDGMRMDRNDRMDYRDNRNPNMSMSGGDRSGGGSSSNYGRDRWDSGGGGGSAGYHREDWSNAAYSNSNSNNNSNSGGSEELSNTLKRKADELV